MSIIWRHRAWRNATKGTPYCFDMEAWVNCSRDMQFDYLQERWAESTSCGKKHMHMQWDKEREAEEKRRAQHTDFKVPFKPKANSRAKEEDGYGANFSE